MQISVASLPSPFSQYSLCIGELLINDCRTKTVLAVPTLNQNLFDM